MTTPTHSSRLQLASRPLILVGLLGYIAVFNASLMLPSPARAVIMVPLVSVIPGWLTLGLVACRYGDGLRKVCYAIALSIGELIAVTLVLNVLAMVWRSPYFLTTYGVCVAEEILIVALFCGNILGKNTRVYSKEMLVGIVRLENVLWVIVLGSGVMLTIGGAIQLNNGVESVLPELVTVYVSGLFVFMIGRRRHLPSWFFPAGVCVSAACMVLQFSLRSNYLFGTDINREFMVFGVALRRGYWLPTGSESLYNLCLSVTLLPIALKALSGLGSYGVFKVVLPLVTSYSAVMCYALARTFVSVRKALLAALFFIAFPSFSGLLATHIRNGIALVFVGVFLLVYFDSGLRGRRRTTFLALAGIGVIVSHYSTAWLFIVMLGIWSLVGTYVLNSRLVIKRRVMTWRLLAILVVVTVLWQVGINNATGGVRQFLGYYSENYTSFVTQGSGSSLGNIVGQFVLGKYNSVTPQQELDAFARHYFHGNASRQQSALTALAASSIPYRVPALAGSLAYLAAQLVSKSLKVCLLVAPLYFAWRLFVRRRTEELPSELVSLAVACLVMVAAVAIVPGASIAYSLGRTYQVMLIVLAIPLVAIVDRGRTLLHLPGSATLIPFLVYFLLYSGLMFSAIGGQPTYSSLSNNAPDHATDYESRPEYEAVHWMAARYPRGVILSDESMLSKLQAAGVFTGLDTSEIVAPLYSGNQSFVVQGSANVRHVGYAYLNGDTVRYVYPSLGLTKNKIYASNGAAVYK